MKSILCFLMLLLSVNMAQASQLEVFEKLVHAYGGAEKIQNMGVVYQEGVTHSNARNTEGKLTRQFSYPDKMQLKIAYDEYPELRELRGVEAFADGKEANPPFRIAVILQATRLMLPRFLLDNRDKLSVLPSADKNVMTFQLDFLDDLSVVAQVDVNTGYILYSEGRGNFSGMPMSFATSYEDFREVDGRIVAFKETHFAMGAQRGFSVLNTVKFNYTGH